MGGEAFDLYGFTVCGSLISRKPLATNRQHKHKQISSGVGTSIAVAAVAVAVAAGGVPAVTAAVRNPVME